MPKRNPHASEKRSATTLRTLILTPQSNSRLAGNQTTAERWHKHLTALGHQAEISGMDERCEMRGQDCDLLIALHAYRSAAAVRRWKHHFPDRPLVLLLTGTDLYQFQIDEPEITHTSMALADRLVGLHDLVWQNVPQNYRHKLSVIRQSSPWLEPHLPVSRPGTRDDFRVLVSGHLRKEKDSLRAAWAARQLPATSRIRIRQAGKAHDGHWQNLADKESTINPRFDNLGELDRNALLEEMRLASVMVMSSFMEGGANAVSEAILIGLPVLASRIDGNVGLLGEDYPAYYEAGDTSALQALLQRAEEDQDWLNELRSHLDRLRPAFLVSRERENIAHLLANL